MASQLRNVGCWLVCSQTPKQLDMELGACNRLLINSGNEYSSVNEAFSAQALACIREWGLQDDDPRINPNGGAIAIGHPLGASGTRIIQTAAIELKKQNKKYALVTMCIGVGQGYATIIERV